MLGGLGESLAGGALGGAIGGAFGLGSQALANAGAERRQQNGFGFQREAWKRSDTLMRGAGLDPAMALFSGSGTFGNAFANQQINAATTATAHNGMFMMPTLGGGHHPKRGRKSNVQTQTWMSDTKSLTSAGGGSTGTGAFEPARKDSIASHASLPSRDFTILSGTASSSGTLNGLEFGSIPSRTVSLGSPSLVGRLGINGYRRFSSSSA